MDLTKKHKKYTVSREEIETLLKKPKESPLLEYIKKMAKDEDIEKVRKILSKIDTEMAEEIVKERNKRT